MTQESQRETTPDRPATAFTQHVRAFHRSLPIEEQRMLEEVFALAEMVASQSSDVSEYASSLDVPIGNPIYVQPPNVSPGLGSSIQRLAFQWGIGSHASAMSTPGAPNSTWGEGL